MQHVKHNSPADDSPLRYKAQLECTRNKQEPLKAGLIIESVDYKTSIDGQLPKLSDALVSCLKTSETRDWCSGHLVYCPSRE